MKAYVVLCSILFVLSSSLDAASHEDILSESQLLQAGPGKDKAKQPKGTLSDFPSSVPSDAPSTVPSDAPSVVPSIMPASPRTKHSKRAKKCSKNHSKHSKDKHNPSASRMEKGHAGNFKNESTNTIEFNSVTAATPPLDDCGDSEPSNETMEDKESWMESSTSNSSSSLDRWTGHAMLGLFVVVVVHAVTAF